MENVCGLTVTEVSEILASGNEDKILIIDCRSFMAFNQGSLVGSVNIHCPPILKRRSGGFIALENIVPCEEKRAYLQNGEFTNILVYDDCTKELSKASGDSNLLSVVRSLLKQVEGLTVRFIVGGFDAVREECPALCMSHDSQLTHCMRDKLTHKDRRRGSQQNEPAEILPHLFLGDVSHSSQRALLDHLGITALLNVSSNCGNLFQSHYHYMNIHINDNMEADLISWFPKVIEFIDKVAAERGKVLVHCRAGVSRSATVCIAYIMQKQGLSLDSAFEFVMSRRPVIDPNLNFIQQLQKFEANLRSQHKTPARPTSLTCSHNLRSAGPAPFSSNSQPPTIFSFSPEKIKQPFVTSSQQDMDISSPLATSLMSPQMQKPHHHHYLQQPQQASASSSQLLKSPCRESQSLDLSPCSLSQTAASPSLVRPTSLPATRPGSLPLLQISTPLSPMLPRNTEASVVSSFLSPSTHQASFATSPLLTIFQEPVEGAEALTGNCAIVPTTRTFSFFSTEIVTCQSLSLPLDMASPRQCRPTTPSALDTGPVPFLGPEHSFPSVSVPHSPLSPLGVPLSPLPSCG